MNDPSNSSGGWSAGKILAVTAAVIAGLMFLSCVGCVGWFLMIPEGGVKLKHEMQPYAIEYLEEHQILRPDEKLVAYYDKTIQLEGTDAYIVTDQRLVHHSATGNFGVPLDQVHRVSVSEGGMGITSFTITYADDDIYRMDIDAFNGAGKFREALQSALRKAGSRVTVPPVPNSAVTTGPGEQPQGQAY